ncbi:hypothetical protein J3F83DRAFT_727817 [Trichoderma novae-zelandiae]
MKGFMGDRGRLAADCRRAEADVLKGVWATASPSSLSADPGRGTAILLAGDFKVSRGGEVGRRAGDAKIGVLISGMSNIIALTAIFVATGSISAGVGSDFLAGGLIGLFANGLADTFSSASSSSESSAKSVRERVSCVIFLGLSGFLPPAWGFEALVAGRAVRAAAAAPPRLAGRPRMPVLGGSLGTATGSMFSLSGSRNVTIFLTGGLLATVVVEVAGFMTVGGRPRGLFTGSGWPTASAGFASTFLGRPRAGLGAADTISFAAAAGFPRAPRTGSAALDAIGAGTGAAVAAPFCSVPTGFFGGRPRGRLACDAWRSSSSASSDLAFLLAAVLAVLAVRDDERGALALPAAAVTFFAGLEADADAASCSLVAALALVRRLGGERIVSGWRSFSLLFCSRLFAAVVVLFDRGAGGRCVLSTRQKDAGSKES